MPGRPDVAIIGAGLAGCAAAIQSGRMGIQCVVFEKGRPFKDKACGDAFMPSAISILYQLGLCDAHFESIGGTAFQTIDLFDNSKLIWRHELKKEVGWMLPRRHLDQLLRELAEKTSVIHYQSKVLSITPGVQSDWKIRYEMNDGQREINVRAVILATGADNKLSASFSISGSPLPSASLSTYMLRSHFKSLVFQFTDLCKNGYAWIFPVNEAVVNVGICVFDGHVPALKRSAEDFLKRWQFSGSSAHWRGGKEPLWSGNAKQWHNANGLISCGDAGALIDPLNGEGITAALHSGRLAGKHIHAYLDNQLNGEHLIDYSNSIKELFTQRYGPTIQRVVWKKLCRL